MVTGQISERYRSTSLGKLMSSSKPSTSWWAAFQETSSALAAVIVGDFLKTGVQSPYYGVAVFSGIAIALLPLVVFALRRKERMLKWYKRVVSSFAIWLSVVMAANVFESAWTIFKIAPTTSQPWAGPLAIVLFFTLVLLGHRIMNFLKLPLGQNPPV